MSNIPERVAYRLNSPGDFYVEDGLCLACTAPLHEAPGLMSHHGCGGDFHCYFKRQPHTPQETEQAIRAVQVGCCGAVRYGGCEPKIIERLVELGLQDDCDHA